MKTAESKSKFKSLSSSEMNNVKGGTVVIRVIIGDTAHVITIK